MSDEPKKRRWTTRIGWAALAVFVLYPLSIFPASLVGAWSVDLGIFRSETVAVGFDTLYAPVIWVMDRVPALRDGAGIVMDAILPLFPRGFPFRFR
jgi:hypothetical protein